MWSFRSLAMAAGALLTATAVLGGVTSCSLGAVGRCEDFVSLPSPEARYDAASLVVDAQVVETSSHVDVFAVYPEYPETVLRTLKGRDVPRSLRVISTTDQCETQGQPVEYVEGDPLAPDGRWKASTSCASLGEAVGGGGAFRLLSSGFLLATASPVAGTGCTELKKARPAGAAAVLEFYRAGSVSVSGGRMTVYDRSGASLGTVVRKS